MKSTKHKTPVLVRFMLAGLVALFTMTACFSFGSNHESATQQRENTVPEESLTGEASSPVNEPPNDEAGLAETPASATKPTEQDVALAQGPLEQLFPAPEGWPNHQQVELENKPAPGHTAALPSEELLEHVSQTDGEGAVSATYYFWEAWKYGYETGDMGPLEKISSPDCQYCTTFSQRITELVESGAQLEPVISPNVEPLQLHSYIDRQGEEWVALFATITFPDYKAAENNSFFAEDSLQGIRKDGWYMELRYDETAQQWRIHGVYYDKNITRKGLEIFSEANPQEN